MPSGAHRLDARELLAIGEVYGRQGKNRRKNVAISFIFSSSTAHDLVVIYADKDANEKWRTVTKDADSYLFAEHSSPGEPLKNWPQSAYGYPGTNNANNSNTFIRYLASFIGRNADVAPGFHPGNDMPVSVTTKDSTVPQPNK